MDGGICFNEWTDARGLPDARQPAVEADAIGQAAIDWTKTRAWVTAALRRLFMNVKGESRGTIDPATTSACAAILWPASRRSRTRAAAPSAARPYRPEDLYRSVNGVAPDLLVYFGDARLALGRPVGMGASTPFGTTRADEANHDWHGIFILSTAAPRPSPPAAPRVSIYDIAPTVLR